MPDEDAGPPFSTRDTPRDFRSTTPRRGALYHVVYSLFLRIEGCFLFRPRVFSRGSAAWHAGGTACTTRRELWASAGLPRRVLWAFRAANPPTVPTCRDGGYTQRYILLYGLLESRTTSILAHMHSCGVHPRALRGGNRKQSPARFSKCRQPTRSVEVTADVRYSYGFNMPDG